MSIKIQERLDWVGIVPNEFEYLDDDDENQFNYARANQTVVNKLQNSF